MTVFSYAAAKKNGEVVEGEREVENPKALAQVLKQEGLLLLDVRAGSGSGREILVGGDIGARLMRLRPITTVDKMLFARNLGVMIQAGLPLTRALEALAQESSHPAMREVIRDSIASVVKGNTLAQTLRGHQRVFGELFVNMIEVGETTGKLTLVLKLLANQLKKDHELKRRVRGAMIYPAIIVTTLVGIGVVMMIYVVPSLVETIQQLGAELPLSTQIIILVSNLLVLYGAWVGIGFLAGAAFFWRMVRTRRGKSLVDRMVLRLPLVGPLIKKFNTARFCRILAYLVTAGVPIVRSLEIVSRVLGNTLFRKAAQDASAQIQTGKELHEILEAHPAIFQPMMVQMVSVGEETGTLSNMLLRVALFFEEEVNATTKNLSTVIEPLLMVVIGIVVAFFAISMLQPIYGSLGNL